MRNASGQPIHCSHCVTSGQAHGKHMGQQRVSAVLVVDSLDLFSGLILPALARSGYPVHRAASADQVLAQFRQLRSQIDLVVLEMVMPGSENFDLAAELARLRPGLAVLYLVGSEPTIARASIEAQSPASVLASPFTEEEFIQRVTGLLNTTAAAHQQSGEQLWDRLIEASDQISSGVALLYLYELAHSALAADHAAMLRSGGIPYAVRPTNYEACPYSIIVPVREAARARALIAEVSVDKRLISAA
jgi:CheY-like chemotaxis protein